MFPHYDLTIPPANLNLKNEEGKTVVLDIIRKKYVALTPEEWVRQHFIHYLIEVMKYPKSLFKIEGGLHYNKLQKRTDIVIRDRNVKAWMLVECKAPTVKISKAAFNQAALYNLTVGAKYVVVTNGRLHFCFESEKKIQLKSLPVFD
ncbi:MAG: restriction endonuclease subunit R, partial [Candidatus Nephrothrix sp. EaCA]